MVVALAVFLLKRGVKPEAITILAGYLGQTKILRQTLRETQQKFGVQTEVGISVQTVDMYQGDENDYVIVSLVRSGVDSIGFLDSLNRRCVAQSRAKRGLYFVGNVDTLVRKVSHGKVRDTVWKPLLDQMKADGSVGSQISICCPDHPQVSRHQIGAAEDLEALLRAEAKFCNVRCFKTMPCKIEEHNCGKTCSPRHDHYRCDKMVDESYEVCGHPVSRRCWEDPKTIACQMRVDFIHQLCGHAGNKKCYVPAEKVECSKRCPKKMNCGKHRCPSKCGSKHQHEVCSALEPFEFPDCGHPGQKKCSESIENEKCNSDVKRILRLCKHEVVMKCHQSEADVVCRQTCRRLHDCGDHACQRACGENHAHNVCTEKVSYRFQGEPQWCL